MTWWTRSQTALTFTVEVDDSRLLQHRLTDAGDPAVAEPYADVRRGYIIAGVRRRLHQDIFRARVLRAYQEQCALCRLRHVELLDAAHIIPDSEPEGEPVVPNGIALCKLHHAAYDRQFLGIRLDYVVVVSRQVLDEDDGPMLRHGVHGLHHSRLHVPRPSTLQPDRKRLTRRFEIFARSSGTP